jgi:diguanylate cyclase (GGDEF)-like protein
MALARRVVPHTPIVWSTGTLGGRTVGPMASIFRRTPANAGLARVATDPHVMLALAVVFSALVIELIAGADALGLVLPLAAFLAVQIGIATRVPSGRSPALDTARLLLALGVVLWMSLRTNDLSAAPLACLYLPIVTLAAVLGTRQAIALGTAAMGAFYVTVVSVASVTPGGLHRGVALAVTMVVLTIGARRTVGAMERAVTHAISASADQRRRARQMAAVEAVGRALATNGPSRAALEEVMDLLVSNFGYRYVSIYTVEGPLMRLGAQRGYDEVIESFDGSIGVVGRVMRTGKAELVSDIAADPDYATANANVRSEVSVPLAVDGVMLGVLNIESPAEAPLDAGDLDTMIVVGDRIAAALALGRERQALQERAELFGRLARFGSAINASLDAATANEAIIGAVADMLQVDITTLILRDPTTGEDRIVAIQGGDERYVGVIMPPGVASAGICLAEGRVVSDEQIIRREEFPEALRGARVPDVLVSASFPLLRDDAVIGAVNVARLDLARVFTALELETMPLIASQITLALNNVELHAQMAEAAVRDPLTGLWNRRHLDVALARLFATRARFDPELRRPVAAILFDLDLFGQFNKRHGHQTGDAVLRAFGSILTRRLRSSDLVARFGGEEFLAVLDGASLDEAQRVAEEIRRELETITIPGSDGEDLHATVSAGCAQLGPNVSSLEALLEVADVGLQMAKRGGRNQVVAA